MVLGCESTRPQPNCSELVCKIERLHNGIYGFSEVFYYSVKFRLHQVYSESPPDLEIIPQTSARAPFIQPTTSAPIRQECPIQCPQGPPGLPGRDVNLM